jgi:lysophospholipase L1-like esterase
MQRRDFLAGLALATAGCAQAQPGAPAKPVQARPTVSQLDAFFTALHGLQDGTRPSPVSILQIGDSHTANDGFSGRMRELMQQRFGNAGRGLLPPGIPFRLYRADSVHVSSSGFALIPSFPAAGPGPFGISGLRQHGLAPASMVVSVDQPGDLALVDFEFLGTTGPNHVRITGDDGQAQTFPIYGPERGPVYVHVSAPRATRLTMEVTSGAVDMMSWRTRRTTPGITWSNLGTIGATVALPARWDPGIVRAELAHENPALIVLAFGSNEGFDDTTDLALYAKRYRATIDLLQEGAPGASLLLVGPPDGVRHPIAGAGTLCPGGLWQSPPKLAAVREVQRGIAREMGLLFWDWSVPMGGTCSMADWAARTPPLASADHLHLLHAGYRLTAESLFSEIMGAYDRFAAAPARN